MTNGQTDGQTQSASCIFSKSRAAHFRHAF